MQHNTLCGFVTLLFLATSMLWSCGDQTAEQSKPLVISKKITVQDKAKLVTPTDEAKTVVDKSPTEPEIKAEHPEVPNEPKRIYDPAKRLNPFLPLFKPDQDKAGAAKASKSKRKKRLPQTPLERISLEQLQLRAIIRASTGNRALVEDNSGKGYIIKNGTYIGLNSGIVTQINADSVIVEEEVENLMGELVLQNTKIKLQKPTGE